MTSRAHVITRCLGSRVVPVPIWRYFLSLSILTPQSSAYFENQKKNTPAFHTGS